MAKTKTNFAKDELRSFIERIERLEEEKAALAADIKEVKAEASGSGFNTKIIGMVLRKRKKTKDQNDETDALFDLYWSAVTYDSTPLGQSASKTTA